MFRLTYKVYFKIMCTDKKKNRIKICEVNNIYYKYIKKLEIFLKDFKYFKMSE